MPAARQPIILDVATSARFINCSCAPFHSTNPCTLPTSNCIQTPQKFHHLRCTLVVSACICALLLARPVALLVLPGCSRCLSEVARCPGSSLCSVVVQLVADVVCWSSSYRGHSSATMQSSTLQMRCALVLPMYHDSRPVLGQCHSTYCTWTCTSQQICQYICVYLREQHTVRLAFGFSAEDTLFFNRVGGPGLLA